VTAVGVLCGVGLDVVFNAHGRNGGRVRVIVDAVVDGSVQVLLRSCGLAAKQLLLPLPQALSLASHSSTPHALVVFDVVELRFMGPHGERLPLLHQPSRRLFLFFLPHPLLLQLLLLL